jgi:hypothetical protein
MADLRPPEACAVAFKEWAGICEALAEGRQSLILRKGGIAEGPGGFVPEHPAFWLYPTRVHEAEQGLRAGRPAPPDDSPAGTVTLRALAVVASIGFVDRPELLPALADLHIWTEETVAKRFHYRKPGLWMLGVRVYRRPEPARLAVTPEHAGCKTWVPLDPPVDAAGAVPALDDAESARRLDRLRAALTPTR